MRSEPASIPSAASSQSAVAKAGLGAQAASLEPLVTILVAEIDPDISDTIGSQLALDGYATLLARTVQHARALAEMRRPRLGIFGELERSRASLELLEQVRNSQSAAQLRALCPWRHDMPVIMLGCVSRELDMLRAFEAGADDFIARPPRYLELRARVRALLRRVESGVALKLNAEELTIDLASREVRLRGIRLELTRMEYELLVCLVADPHRVVSKQELLSRIWGYGSGCATRTLDSHASRLRRKLATLDARPWVVNVRGVGYRLN